MMSLVVFTASAADVEQFQSSMYSDTLFSSFGAEAAPTFASPANRAPPVATVMPLYNSHNFPSAPSVQPTAQWSEPQPAVIAEPIVGSRRASAPPVGNAGYHPVAVHWFYCRNIELRQIWQPFSVVDSASLESAHQSIVSGKISRLLAFTFLADRTATQ